MGMRLQTELKCLSCTARITTEFSDTNEDAGETTCECGQSITWHVPQNTYLMDKHVNGAELCA